MEKITKDNFVQALQRAGCIVSKCGVCGIPKWKVVKVGINDTEIEIRPTHAQYGTYAVLKNRTIVNSGYLYELDQVFQKYFPA